MTAQQKQSIMDVQRNLHQVMTIVGFPILLILVGDMYKDFKKVRDNDIKQEIQIAEHDKKIQEMKHSMELMGNYVWRGIK